MLPFTRRPAGRTSPLTSRPVALAVHLALAGLPLAAPTVQAQTTPPSQAASAAQRAYDIPAGPLGAAITRFVAESGALIAADGALTQGKMSGVLQGSYAVQDALARLLAGTGLEAGRQADGSYAVRRAAPSTAAPAAAPLPVAQAQPSLPEVKVRASAETLPSELPKPYAGGQVARGGGVGFLGNRDIFETPFNVTHFTHQTIQDQQAIRIEDVVKGDPAVRVGNTATSFYQDFIIRGYRVTGNGTLFNGLSGIYPQYGPVALAGIERVEVFKGANTLLAGVGTSSLGIGGSINLVPKRAEDKPITQLTTSYASDSQFGAQIDVGQRFGTDNQFGARLNVLRQSGSTPFDNERDRLGFYALALDYRGEHFRAFIDTGKSKQNTRASLGSFAVDPGVAVPKPPKRGSNYVQPFAFSDTDTEYAIFRGEVDLTESITAYTSYGTNWLSFKQLLPFALLHDSDGTIDEIFQNGSGRERNHVYSVGLNAKFDTGPVKHQLALTATHTEVLNRAFYVFDEASGSQATVVSNLYNPTRGIVRRPDMLFARNAQLPKNFDNVNSSQAIADTLSVLEERVQLTLGVRHQKLSSTSFDVSTLTSNLRTGGYSKGALTPAVAGLVKLTPIVSLYANYIESLEGGPTAPDTAINRNQVFPPSKDKQREVGVKVDLGRVGLTSSLYEIKQPSGILDPTTNVFSLNGKRRSRGLEFNVFGEPVSGVRLNGGVAVTKAKIVNTEDGLFEGNRPTGVSKTNFALSGEWDLPPLPGLTLTADVLRTGAVFIDQANTRQIKGFTDTGLGLRYKTQIVGKPLVLRADVSNVFDRNHFVADVYGSFYQTAPRAVRMSATVDF